MQTATIQQPVINPVKKPSAAKKDCQNFQSIETETRTNVPTDCAAFWLNRQPQTLRAWACLENGPIRPLRINGRLAWATAEIKRLLNGDQ